MAKTLNVTIPDVSELQRAIRLEINAVGRNHSKLISVAEGRLISQSDDGFLYSFKADFRLAVPPEAPIHIHMHSGQRIRGTWISQNDFDVLVVASELLSGELSRAKISADLTYILMALCDRLDEENTSSLCSSLFETNASPTNFSQSALARSIKELDARNFQRNHSQYDAIKNCISNDVHFVWGPPGTGKTVNLAQVAKVLEGQGERVLVQSHANVAVDVAALKIADAFDGTSILRNGGILRVGISQLPELRKREDITAFGAIRIHYPDLVERLHRTETERDDLVSKIARTKNAGDLRDRLNEVRDELARIRKQVHEAEGDLIKHARIILATSSKFVIDERIWKLDVENTIIDEVSMMGFPFVFAAAKQALKRVLLFGDFRQLPPVCVSDEQLAKEWLGRDAFDIVGIQKSVDRGKADSRVTLLDTQYRMHENIGNVVSKFSYNGKLKTNPSTSAATMYLSQLRPEPGSAVAIIDSSNLHTACFVEKKRDSYSRINPMHALLSLSVALELSSDSAQVAILTPYSAQAKLISGLIASLRLEQKIASATIHRFQGAEIDAIVLDLVDALPQYRASQLTGSDTDLSQRLLNVAISRCKGKLVLVTDRSFIETHHNGRSPAQKLNQLLADVESTHFEPARCSLDVVQWCESWSAAQIKLYALICDETVLGLNIPSNFHLSGHLGRKITELNKDSALHRTYQEPFLFIQTSEHCVIGGRSSDGPIAIIPSPSKQILERAIIGDEDFSRPVRGGRNT